MKISLYTVIKTCSYIHALCRQELSQMNLDLEARLQSDNLQSSEQLALLTQQLSTAQQEAQVANRLLEEARAQLQDMQKQHQENVSLGVCSTFISCKLVWKGS